MGDEPLLEVRDLSIGFPARDGLVLAADRVSFSVAPGACLGLVGESGCGKSVTLRALVDLVPRPGEILEGSIAWKGADVRTLAPRERHALRGRAIATIFQDPTSSLDPVLTIGDQLVETLRQTGERSRSVLEARAIELLDHVGIPSAPRRLGEYPHQLSGGMRQRVMIALAIATDPSLLLADEPTTALDVTIQDQILALLAGIRAETAMAMILVSHDMGVIARDADEIAVMYAGRIVEHGPADAVLHRARHPYTRGLLAAIPRLEPRRAGVPLVPIAGQPPDLADLPPGCPFGPRCPEARPACTGVPMLLDAPPPEHGSACPFVGVPG
jgi:oligopeptide/dipeptide ABC transporter ATP-binding protein